MGLLAYSGKDKLGSNKPEVLSFGCGMKFQENNQGPEWIKYQEEKGVLWISSLKIELYDDECGTHGVPFSSPIYLESSRRKEHFSSHASSIRRSFVVLSVCSLLACGFSVYDWVVGVVVHDDERELQQVKNKIFCVQGSSFLCLHACDSRSEMSSPLSEIWAEKEEN